VENKGKVPKRIHKSEREKLKREQLNELFLELASALGKFNGFFFSYDDFCIHRKLD